MRIVKHIDNPHLLFHFSDVVLRHEHVGSAAIHVRQLHLFIMALMSQADSYLTSLTRYTIVGRWSLYPLVQMPLACVRLGLPLNLPSC